MKNNNIADTFEYLAPSEVQKDKIYRSVVSGRGNEKAIPRFKVVFACCAVVCIIVAAVIALDSLCRPDNAALAELGGAQTVPSAANSSVTVATQANTSFPGFVLTAYRPAGGAEYLGADYANEAERLALTPDVRVLLAKYSPVMNCVPGLPFTIDVQRDPDGLFVEAFRISVDGGELCEWNQQTGVVTRKGSLTTMDLGGTIYWSPLGSEDVSLNEPTSVIITVEAVSGGDVVGRQEIYITRDEPGWYYATAGEPELL